MRDVFICGSGRSGTSMLAGMFAGAGYFQGDDLYPPRDANPKGFFENWAINSLNERIILASVRQAFGPEAAGFMDAYYRPGQFWLARLPAQLPCAATEDDRRSIEALTKRRPFAFKDPRFSFTLEAWSAAVPDAVAICVFRDPGSVISSILKETQSAQYLADLRLSVADLYEAWRNVHLRLLNLGARGQRLCFVSQELLLRKETHVQLEGVIGAKLDQTFPDASLIRQRFEGTLDERTRSLFEALQALAARPLAEQDAHSFQECLETLSAPADSGPLSFPPRTSAEPARGPDALPVPISTDFLFPPSAVRALFYRLKEDQDALRTRADADLEVSRQTVAKLGGLESGLERLASDVVEANRHATEATRPIGELLARIETLEGSLASRDLELRKVESRLEDTLSNLASESVAKDRRIAALESDLSSAHQRHLHDASVITRLDEALDRERVARDAADVRAADSHRDVATLRDELTREHSRQADLRERLATVDAEHRRLATEVDLRKREIDALRQEITDRAGTLAASNALVEDLRAQLAQIRSSHSWQLTAPLRAIRRWFGAR